MKKNTLIEGTLIAYIILLIIKICGALYVIPFYKIVGQDGGVLYSYAYSFYNFFLNISTSGIPIAVSIIISEFNTLKMFNEREYSYKIANKVIFIFSFVSFILMFTCAPLLAKFFVSNADISHINNIVLVIRVISFCLLVVPFLSVTRGYLQGNKYISVVSFSQLIEQFVKMFVVLLGSYIAINILHYKVSIGVAVALSGTVISALIGYIYLKNKIRKNKKHFKKDVSDPLTSKISYKEIVKKIFIYAVPLVLVSITQNLYDIVDIKLIIEGLTHIGFSLSDAELISSIVATWCPKICMVINALAIGLCASIVPFVVEGFVKKNYELVNEKFNQSIKIILYVSIPLSILISLYSTHVYNIFYGNNVYGPNILAFISIISILFSLMLVINSILQSMKKHKLIYLNTFAGLILNLILDIPMILLLNKLNFKPFLGTLCATFIGQIISLIIVFVNLKKSYNFKYNDIFNSFKKILFSSFLMFIFAYILKLNIYISNIYIIKILEIGIIFIICLSIYLLITYYDKTVEEIFGKDIFKRILKKLKKVQ